jgi:hypothetical protein
VTSGRRRRLEVCAVALLALLVITIGIVWGSRVAAGADAYGYVSQADLWLRGHLYIDQSFFTRVPWPMARWTFVPLGYWPSGYGIVPQYPPGLPLLMAAAKGIAGQCAMFWIVPLCGGALVVATYVMARRLGEDGAALGAAWIVATSPTVLFMTIAPMSDVPAAAAWAVAIASVLGETTGSAAAGGVAAASAILIRPNLVPLAGVLVIWLGLERRRADATVFAAIAVAGAIAVAMVNSRLYGSPFRTGYDLTDGFALRYVPTNVARYAGWLISAEPALALGVVFLGARSRARALTLSCAVVVFTIYLLYVPWDAWWYLRFLLPIWPLAAVAAARTIARVRQPGHRGRLVAAAMWVAIGVYGGWQAYRRDSFDAARGEAKYVEVARAVDAIVDPDAVIISAQHSGSIRYYAGRLTLRWDVGDVAWLDRTVDWLAANGHHPYFVLEPQEIEQLRARYGRRNATARLDWTPMVVFRSGAVTMFDAMRREATGTTVAQEELKSVRDCPVQRPFPTLR